MSRCEGIRPRGWRPERARWSRGRPERARRSRGRAERARRSRGPVLGGLAVGLGARPAAAAALVIPQPRSLRANPLGSRWARGRRATVARAAPSAGAPPVARVGTRTPEGTANPLQVLGRREDAAGRLWVRVRLAVLPDGTTGWVPRRALGGYQEVRERLRIDLRRRTLVLLRDGRPVLRARVGIGEAATPTPRGRFFVRNRLERYASPAYGPLAFGLSARSQTLTDWPAGGYVGIHGTDRPDLLPGRVSHGASSCATPTSCGSGASCPWEPR